MDSSNTSMTGMAASDRNDILQQIACQAASVRRQFEANPSKRKHTVSSATVAAAQHMASLNRKRKFETDLAFRASNVASSSSASEGAMPVQAQSTSTSDSEFNIWKQTSHTFHSPIASFTRPEKSRQVSSSSAPAAIRQSRVAPAPAAPRVSDGIILKSAQGDLTVSYNDVVCGKGKTTSSLVGNQRYKVWIALHKESYAKAFYNQEEQRQIAASIINAVTCTSVPAGRFLSLDYHSGLWYDVGYERAVGITMETLMAESGMMMNMKATHQKQTRAVFPHPPMGRRASIPRVFTSKAA